MSVQDRFEQILASLQAAMLDDAHWAVASGLIDDLCGAKGNHLVFSSDAWDDGISVFFMRFCYGGAHRTDLEEEYFTKYYPADEHLPRLRQLSDGRIAHMSELLSEEQLKHSATYNEMMPRYHFCDGLNIRLDGPHGSRIIWGIADPRDGQGWSTHQVEVVARLVPHIRQFVRVRHALIQARAEKATLEGLLENTRAGVIQLDRDRRIVAANDRTHELLDQGALLADRDGRLHLANQSDNTRLQRLLDRALPRFAGRGESGSMMVKRPSSRSARDGLVLHVAPVRDREADFGTWAPAALVLVIEPRVQGRIDRLVLRRELGLSKAESEVAALVAEGKSIPEIMAVLGRGEHTVRWHIKQSHAKLGVSRQAEVTRIVRAVAGILPEDQS